MQPADTGADFKRYLGQRLPTNTNALLAGVLAAVRQISALLPALHEPHTKTSSALFVAKHLHHE